MDDHPNSHLLILELDDAEIGSYFQPLDAGGAFVRGPGIPNSSNPPPAPDDRTTLVARVLPYLRQETLQVGENSDIPCKPKRKRQNQKVMIGNNKTGRMGKLRCDTCRKHHSKCEFEEPSLPCLRCQKDNPTSLCVKRWGPSKESLQSCSIEDTISLLTLNSLYHPEPSRPPPTAINAVIDPREVQMLQCVYTLETRYRDRDHHAHWQILTQIVHRLTFIYGMSIGDYAIRTAVLACAGAVMFIEGDGHSEHEQQLDEYSTRVCQALRRKDPTAFQAEEFFVIFFLAIAESFRFSCYQKTSRPTSDLSRARRDLSVHIRGSLAIEKHLADGPDVGVASRFGQIWLYAQDLLALWGIYANPVEIVDLALLYRERISKVETLYSTSTDTVLRSQAVMITTGTASAFGNFLISLSKILLEGLIDEEESSPLQKAATAEIKQYLHFADRGSLFWKEVTSSHASRDRHYSLLQLVASKVILHVAKEPLFSESYLEGFLWAKELVAVAQSFHDESLFRVYEDLERQAVLQIWDERVAVMYVGVASLVIPPTDCFQHRGAVVRFLTSCGASEMSGVVEQYWKARDRIHVKRLVEIIIEFFG